MEHTPVQALVGVVRDNKGGNDQLAGHIAQLLTKLLNILTYSLVSVWQNDMSL